MARLPRLIVPGEAHYLILRGHAGLSEPGICWDEQDRDTLLAALREAALNEGVQIHAYALLPTELQLLATPAQDAALGRMIQGLGRRYVSAYNRRHGRRGTLWDGRFRCALVEAGASRLAVLQLIDGQAEAIATTSATHRTGGARQSLIADIPEVWSLGNTPFEREAAYRELLATGLVQATRDKLRLSALGGWAIGSPAYIAELTGGGPRPVVPRARGRPRKSVEQD